MDTCINKLCRLASDALCGAPPDEQPFDDLGALLRRRNGFYAFESALHVLPACTSHQHMSLHEWNEPSNWKFMYGDVLNDYLCFAEDIFGEQFAVLRGEIVKFNPESAETTFVAKTLDEWACRLLVEYELLTGYSFAHEWQEQFGPIPSGKRLVPKMPFIFGGKYEVDNFYVLDATKAMGLRADLWQQTRTLPDGARVKITVT